MPEGPDLHLASRFIQTVCKGKYFSGKVQKSEISKCPRVSWDVECYKITSSSRGKEIKLTLTEIIKGQKKENKPTTKLMLSGIKAEARTLDIIFRFGLVGKFRFDQVEDIQKHAHLNFYIKDDNMVLSYVDYMRYGTWEPNGVWGSHRGPCVLMEYDLFRNNVLENLRKVAFNKPICEALLNQRYFNGIGNYLRAEVLYRCGVRPFEQAREVLEPLTEESNLKSKTPDILQMCHTVSSEAVNLSTANQTGYDTDAGDDENSAFSKWLQCYYKPGMNSISDHNRRTIWYTGDPGPLAPEDVVLKHQKRSRSKIPKKTAVVTSTQKISAKGRKTKSEETIVTEKVKSRGKAKNDQHVGKIKNKPPRKRIISKADTVKDDGASVPKRARSGKK